MNVLLARPVSRLLLRKPASTPRVLCTGAMPHKAATRPASKHMGNGWRAMRLRHERRRKEEQLFFMEELRPDITGLPMYLWVSSASQDQFDQGTTPELKVMLRPGCSYEGPWFTMTIEDEPYIPGRIPNVKESDLDLIEEFIVLNKDVLLEFWADFRMDISDVCKRIRRVGA